MKFAKNPLLALLLTAGVVTAAGASQFFITVPLKKVEKVGIYLLQSPLAQARVGQTYRVDLNELVRVQGNTVFDPSLITWSMEGTLPPGLSFDTATGILSGKASVRTPAQTLRFHATYKGYGDAKDYSIAAIGPSLQKVGSGTFGDRDAGASASSTIRLTNDGDLPITLNPARITSVPEGAFTIQSNDCGAVLSSAESCSVVLGYAAPAGEATGGLDITAADPSDVPPVTVSLSGFGLVKTASLVADSVPPVSVNSALEFGVTLRNTGNVPLTADALGAGSVTGDAYSVSDNGCRSQLAVGASCTVLLTFSPTSVAAHTGSLTLVTSAGQKKVTFTGQGVVSDLQMNPSLGFIGAAQLGGSRDSQVVTLRNNGGGVASNIALTLSDPLFSVTSSTCTTSLGPGATCDFKVKFKPIEAGVRRAVLQVASSESKATMPVSASGREVSVSVTGPSSNIQVWYPSVSPFPITVNNYGSGQLALNGIRINTPGTYYTRNTAGDTCKETLAANSSCVYSINAISQLPAGWGPYTSFTVDTDAGEVTSADIRFSTLRTNITMTPNTVNFGQVTVGNSAVSAAIRVANTGNSGTVAYSLPAGVTVAESTCPASGVNFPLNNVCSMKFQYTPSAAGTLSAKGNWTWRGGLDGSSIQFDGVAVAATEFALSNLDFGWTDVGVSETGLVTVSNPTSGAIALSGKTLTGNSEFSLVPGGTCGDSLAAKSSCTQQVAFAPTARGARVPATLSIGSASTQIQGKGAIAQLAFSPSVIDFGKRSVDIDNSGRPTITMQLVNSGDPTKRLVVTVPTRGSTAGNGCTNVLTETQNTCNIVFAAYPDHFKDAIGVEQVGEVTAVVGAVKATGYVKITPVNPTATLTTPSFAPAKVGSGGTKALITLQNTTSSRITLANPGVSGNVSDFFFDASNTTCTSALPYATSCVYSISFMPSETGTRPEGTFSVNIGNGQIISVPLRGVGE